MATYAQAFIAGRFPPPSERALRSVERFHLDSVACAVSALACKTNAPRVLRQEALSYRLLSPGAGAYCFGSSHLAPPEKAVLANSAAVREWDANGTNFGYNPSRGHVKGEFGHNDFYPVAIAAAQQRGSDGRRALMAMLALDEIRGRLAEVFSLKSHKVDHVVHGAIASAVVYGALMGATVDQIESAVGLVVAHSIPFRAIRHGKQLSDSKGASAAISAEFAVLAVERAMRGFVGPADVFRNPEAIFCLFEPPEVPGQSPFELVLATGGDGFAVCGMHYKLGLYEHQSAGAIQGVIDLLQKYPAVLDSIDKLRRVRITIYEPAFGIIGDPAKRNPQTRQSADHSMVYIISTLLRKAFAQKLSSWRELMLMPGDYSPSALADPLTRNIIERIDFRHGGPEYDRNYPDGIPTTVDFEHEDLGWLSSGLVMYPEGHARCASRNLEDLLDHKFRALAALAVDNVAALYQRFSGLREKTAQDIARLYDFRINGLEEPLE